MELIAVVIEAIADPFKFSKNNFTENITKSQNIA
jgi:hypothetical protein